MFSSAKKIARPVAEKSAKGGTPKTIVEGWEEIAALDAVAKAVSALAEERKAAFKEDVLKARFVAEGQRVKGKPDSLSPVEGSGRGAAYVAKRSTASELSLDELNLIADMVGDAVRNEDGIVLSIPGFTERVEKQPGYLAVNPAYVGNAELLAQIDEALTGVEGIPEDFIVRIEPEDKAVVSDTAIGMMFQKGSNVIASLFDTLALVGMRPVFGGSMERAWEIVKPLMPAAEKALADNAERKKADKAGKPGKTGGALTAALKASLQSLD